MEAHNITIPARLPFLEAVCWQVEDVFLLTPFEMLNRYERGWTYRGVVADLGVEEAAFLGKLVKLYGSWLACHV